VLRTLEEITEFFDGFDLLEPGVVQLSLWRPNGDLPSAHGLFGGVGRKP
jgi:S-adenosyl methyltransferase